jgi:hypothetical protein
MSTRLDLESREKGPEIEPSLIRDRLGEKYDADCGPDIPRNFDRQDGGAGRLDVFGHGIPATVRWVSYGMTFEQIGDA